MGKIDEKKEQNQMNKKSIKYALIIGVVLVAVVSVILFFFLGRKKDASTQKAFQVGEQDVYMDEVNICVLQTMLSLGMNRDMLSQSYANNETMADYYKDYVYKMMVLYKVENEIAKQQNLELTEDERSALEADVRAFLVNVNGHSMRKWNINSEDVSKVFYEQHLAHKLEQEMVKDIQVEDQHYVTLYLMLFPKIVTDENGDFEVEEDGKTPKLLDSEAIEKLKEDAKKAREQLANDEEEEEVAKTFGVELFSEKQSNMTESFDEPFIPYAKSLKEGECSEVFETASCFAVVKMLSEKDEEKEKQIFGTRKADLEEEELEKQRKEWYEQMNVTSGKNKIWKPFEKLSLYDFVD